jgi:RNA polymerase sigma-70 factor (ECF subfamily)
MPREDVSRNTAAEQCVQERHLVERAVAGDARAFAELCERHRKRVWRVAASVTRSDADADDLAQEAFVRAFGAVRSYRPDASFAAWLCRIALNAAHDHQKSAWKRRVQFWSSVVSTSRASGRLGDEWPDHLPRTSDVASGPGELTPHREMERRELRRRVRAAVAQLKPSEATPIWMIYFEEFTLAEVARLERQPESTIRSRVKAGLRRLEIVLGDLRDVIDGSDEAGSGSAIGPGATYCSAAVGVDVLAQRSSSTPAVPGTKGGFVCR